MQLLDVSTTVSTEGGLFFQRDIEFPKGTVETPVKTNPVGKFTKGHTVDGSVRDIAEVHAKIDTGDLEAIRSDTTPRPIRELNKDLLHENGSEIVVVLLEYTDAQEIDPMNMRTILKIQNELGDVLTMPQMPSITDALSPIVDSDVRFENSPWDPYYSSVRHFLENAVDYDMPVMGMLPLIGWSRCREVMREYEASNVQLYAVDFAGLKATAEAQYNHLQNIVADISKRPRNQEEYKESVLYSINYKRYHPIKNADQYPSEAFALITEGIDIAGGTHRHRHGGSDDIEITDTKIFNSGEFEFDSVPLEGLQKHWGYPTSIPVADFATVGEKKRRELRHIANAEMMNFGLRKLRAAIQNGDEQSFLEQKSGYEGTVSTLAEDMVKKYNDAQGPDVV